MADYPSPGSKRPPTHRDDADSIQDSLDASQTPNKLPKSSDTLFPSSTPASTPVPLTSAPEATPPTPTTESRQKSDDNEVRRGRTILSLGYLGEGYQGLQANANAKTIEPVLLEALLKAEAIESNTTSLDAVRWDKCARTDKGVSAACNFVSLNIKCFPDLVDRINAHLPETMRFWHFQRVGKSFRAHIRAGGRRYIYVLPTQLFRPTNLADNETFAFTEETRQTVNRVLSSFVGTHRFHHFTQSISAKSQEANRTIDSFECGAPMIQEGIEWVQLTVIGSSFLIYQIRKMVGAAVTAVRDGKGPEYISALFEDITFPGLQIAPGEGLFLDECLYDAHNASTEPPNEPIKIDGVRHLVEAFKEQVILPSIYKHEREHQTFTSWVELVDKWPIDWEKILKDGNDAVQANKEFMFQEAKRKGLASVRGVETAEDYYNLTKAKNAQQKNVQNR